MEFFTLEGLASLATLTLLEIVLGIDNIIFISIIVEKLPKELRPRTRFIGLSGALVMRIMLLMFISYIAGLTTPLFHLMDIEVSWRNIILMGGGLFLLVKGTLEIHHTMEEDDDHSHANQKSGYWSMIIQIMLLDLVFSLDSIITAIGMTNHLPIMIAAVIISIAVMMLASGPVSGFINRHPTTKMLALSFLLLVGIALVADGLHYHIPRGYLYFAIAFSLIVELLNLAAKKKKPVN